MLIINELQYALGKREILGFRGLLKNWPVDYQRVIKVVLSPCFLSRDFVLYIQHKETHG